MSRTRTTIGLALGVTVLAAGAAIAAPAPTTTSSSSTFFLRQEGCGASDQQGRLEPKAGTDGSTGCGTIGGVPINEVVYRVDGEASFETFDTVGKGLPIKLNGAKKITGQVAAESWFGAGGVGTVSFDVALRGTTSAGKAVDFGTATVSASASPSANVAMAPFELAVPAAAAGASFTKFSMDLAIRGANVGMSARRYDGDSYIVFPTTR